MMSINQEACNKKQCEYHKLCRCCIHCWDCHCLKCCANIEKYIKDAWKSYDKGNGVNVTKYLFMKRYGECVELITYFVSQG